MTEAKALSVQGLEVSYGGIRALKGVSLEVSEGEIVALVGANGAGKTTTLASILRLVAPRAGKISLFGRDTAGLSTHQIVELGVALVPEGRAIFSELTVRENLELGGYGKRRQKGLLLANFERAITLFPRLGERLNQEGGTLSGGEQQMLAIARALMANPKLLLLDEPSLGLAPLIVAQIFEQIVAIAASGLTILLVEQNTRLALKVAHRAYCLATGEISLSGPAAELACDPRIKSAYLGDEGLPAEALAGQEG